MFLNKFSLIIYYSRYPFNCCSKLRSRLNTQKCVIYTKIFIHKSYLMLLVSKYYLKLVRATRGYNLTSEPQTLEAELPLNVARSFFDFVFFVFFCCY